MHSNTKKNIVGAFFILFSAAVFFGLGTYICKPALATSCDSSHKNAGPANSQQLNLRYFTYTPLIFEQALSQNKKIVLYFYAPWCITCASLDVEIATRPEIIPEDVIVLRLKFDEPSELKTKYGITLPHSFVWVDATGEVIAQWVGGDSVLIKENTR